MSTRIRLIIDEYTEIPMWRDTVLIPPQVGEILVLSFGHFKIFELYHHSPPLRELAPTEYSSGASMSVRIRLARSPSKASLIRHLNQYLSNTSVWLEVPEDEQFWIPPT